MRPARLLWFGWILFSYAVRSLQKCQNWRAGVSYFGCFCYVLRHKSGAYLGPAPIMSAGADLAPTPAKRLGLGQGEKRVPD